MYRTIIAIMIAAAIVGCTLVGIYVLGVDAIYTGKLIWNSTFGDLFDTKYDMTIYDQITGNGEAAQEAAVPQPQGMSIDLIIALVIIGLVIIGCAVLLINGKMHGDF